MSFEKLLGGYIAGVNSTLLFDRNESRKTISIMFYDLTPSLCMQESVNSKLLDNHWEECELPNLRSIDVRALRSQFVKFFVSVLSKVDFHRVADGILRILNDDFYTYGLFSHLSEEDDEGRVLFFVIQHGTERKLVVLLWSWED